MGEGSGHQMADLGNAANWDSLDGTGWDGERKEEGRKRKQLKVASLLPWTPCDVNVARTFDV